jgi:hypothetical protein
MCSRGGSDRGGDRTGGGGGDGDGVAWVQCDLCDKWRVLPQNMREWPLEIFECPANSWDRRFDSCEKPEVHWQDAFTVDGQSIVHPQYQQQSYQRRYKEKKKARGSTSSGGGGVYGCGPVGQVIRDLVRQVCRQAREDARLQRRAQLVQRSKEMAEQRVLAVAVNELVAVACMLATDGTLLLSDGHDGGWVQCDRCNKWRTIPKAIESMLPEVWTCEMNAWDEAHNNCTAPEISWSAGIVWLEGSQLERGVGASLAVRTSAAKALARFPVTPTSRLHTVIRETHSARRWSGYGGSGRAGNTMGSLVRHPLSERNNDPVRGWHREERRRISQPDKSDVYYHTPDGQTTLRSGPDVTRYIERMVAEGGLGMQEVEALDEAMFTFSRAGRLRKLAMMKQQAHSNGSGGGGSTLGLAPGGAAQGVM